MVSSTDSRKGFEKKSIFKDDPIIKAIVSITKMLRYTRKTATVIRWLHLQSLNSFFRDMNRITKKFLKSIKTPQVVHPLYTLVSTDNDTLYTTTSN